MKPVFSIIFAFLCFFVSNGQEPRADVAGLKPLLTVDLDKQFKGPPFWFYLSKTRRLLVFSKDKTSVFDVETGGKLPSLPPLNSDALSARISTNPDETRFVLYRSRRSELWDLKTMKLIRKLPENDSGIIDVLWSDDGSRFMLSTGGWITKKTHYIYDAENGSTKFIITTKYKSTAVFSKGSPSVMTVEKYIGYRRKDLVKVWSSESGELLHDLLFKFRTNAVWPFFSPSGKYIIVIHDIGDPPDIFDSRTGEMVKSLDMGKDAVPKPEHITFSPDGKKMLLGVWKFRGIFKDEGTWFRIYNTETFQPFGELRTQKPAKHQVELHQVVWRPDSLLVIAAGERFHRDYEAEAWNLSTLDQKYTVTGLIAKQYLDPFEGGYKNFDEIEFTANSKYLVTTNRGKANILRIWDADTGKLLTSSDRTDGFFQLTLDKRYLLKRSLTADSVSLYDISF